MLVHKGDKSLKYENTPMKAYSAGQQLKTTQKGICMSEEIATQSPNFEIEM